MGVTGIFAILEINFLQFCFGPFSRFAPFSRQSTPFLVPISLPQVVLFPVTVIARYSQHSERHRRPHAQDAKFSLAQTGWIIAMLVNQSGTSNKLVSFKCTHP